MNTLHQIRHAAFAAFTFLMAASSFGDTFVIIDGPGVGAVIEGTPTGGGFFDVTDDDPVAATSGTIIPGDVECMEPHYHGTLFGEPDPHQQGCGWGRVQNVTDVATRLIDLRNVIAANIGDTVLKTKLNAILDAIVNAVGDECFSVMEGGAAAFGRELTGAFVREAINQAAVNTIKRPSRSPLPSPYFPHVASSKAPEGRRTPKTRVRPWRDRASRQRLGVRQPSGALSGAHTGITSAIPLRVIDARIKLNSRTPRRRDESSAIH